MRLSPRVPLPPSPFPAAGPSLFTVRGFQNVTIAAGASLGPPGSDATVTDPLCSWWFPRDLFVTGVLVCPSGATIQAHLAELQLRIQDETFQDMILSGSLPDPNANCAALMRQPPQKLSNVVRLQPFALQRPVRTHDQWLFTLTNSGAGPIDVAALLIYFAEPRGGHWGAGVNT